MKCIKNSMVVYLFGLFLVILCSNLVFASDPQLNITMSEYVYQDVLYNPIKERDGLWSGAKENQTLYELKGFFEIENKNPDVTISDAYIVLNHTSEIALIERDLTSRNATIYGYGQEGQAGILCHEYRPCFNTTMNSSILFNNTNHSQNVLILHIPELRPGETTYWNYTIRTINTAPVLNVSTNYSRQKALAGWNFSVDADILHEFSKSAYQDSCVYDINISFDTNEYANMGNPYEFTFILGQTAVTNNTNFNVSEINNRSFLWYANQSTYCFDYGDNANITYMIQIPENIPTSEDYIFLNTTLSYKMHLLISKMNIQDIYAVTDKVYFNFTKEIVDIAHKDDTADTNVTWEINPYMYLDSNITYNISKVTLWVSKRNGATTDVNELEVDQVNDNITLQVNYTWLGYEYVNATGDYVNDAGCLISSVINKTNPWMPCKTWLFNFSEPVHYPFSPIVWMDVNHMIWNDNYENISYSNYSENNGQYRVFYRTFNHTDKYYKEIYIIVGYWLEILKNVTLVDENIYNVVVKVHNKGNRFTPRDTTIKVYDFIPTEFTVLTDLTNVTNASTYSQSDMYRTAYSDNTVSGAYEGDVLIWSIIPDNVENVSFAPGHLTDWTDMNSTFWVNYTVEGDGEFRVSDLYITGLDPVRVDGAGESITSIFTQMFDVKHSKEWLFALTSLLMIGCLVVIKIKKN